MERAKREKERKREKRRERERKEEKRREKERKREKKREKERNEIKERKERCPPDLPKMLLAENLELLICGQICSKSEKVADQ